MQIYDAKTSLGGFLDAAAARQPSPGGGSVTALVGALASSMGEMCVQYSLGKKDLEAFAAELTPILSELTRARKMLLDLMVDDQTAFDALSIARKLPADHPDRATKFGQALLACIRTPEAVASTGVAVLSLCDRMVNFINPHLLSDLAVCADLAMASIRCSVYSVRANLVDVKDPEDRRRIEGRIQKTLSNAVTLIQSVAPRIWERHGS